MDRVPKLESLQEVIEEMEEDNSASEKISPDHGIHRQKTTEWRKLSFHDGPFIPLTTRSLGFIFGSLTAILRGRTWPTQFICSSHSTPIPGLLRLVIDMHLCMNISSTASSRKIHLAMIGSGSSVMRGRLRRSSNLSCKPTPSWSGILTRSFFSHEPKFRLCDDMRPARCG
jgi:hypothetical protein